MVSNQPYSEQVRIKALEWADLDNASRMLKECKSAYLAQKKSALGDISAAKAEMQVKSTKDWTDYIQKMVNAEKRANIAKIELEYIKMKSWENSSSEANRRAEMKAL